MRMLYHATSEARKAVLPFIDDWDRHWRRHERVFVCIRDNKPALARKAVLEDLHYAESLLREHAVALSKGRLVSGGRLKRRSTNSGRRKR
jgi:DNA-binding GntR family transcriptional regulator